MNDNEKLIERFYTCFQNLDGDGMARCYHDEVEFSDPIFPDLKGERARAMWKMLCIRANQLELTFDHIQADDHTGSAHWEAKYTFITTGRRVHNRIDAAFEFKDGKIVRHRDRFDFWQWSKMAFGPMGWALGLTPLFRKNVRKQAATSLNNYIEHARLR